MNHTSSPATGGPSALPLVMGVLNVTPDSFSDGGRFDTVDEAIAFGRRLIDEGAAIVDVGGESTRPGSHSTDPDEQCRRVLPVIEALSGEVRISIDTRSAAVARAAVGAGATLINDVSSSLGPIAAEMGVGWLAMHMLGEPATMQEAPRYHDVVAEVLDHLVERAEAAVAAGVSEVWIDPGIGFGKTDAHNLALLADIGRFVATGYPVAVGTSRKGFLGRLLAASDRTDAAPSTDDRLEGSLATAVWALHSGVRMIRAHDVLPTWQASRVVAA